MCETEIPGAGDAPRVYTRDTSEIPSPTSHLFGRRSTSGDGEQRQILGVGAVGSRASTMTDSAGE
jgi:hypothetical protein